MPRFFGQSRRNRSRRRAAGCGKGCRARQNVSGCCYEQSSSVVASLARLALRQPPVRADEVAGVAIGIAVGIVLMLRLRFPEVADGRDLRGGPARPDSLGVRI